jgi:16S rRNA (guanine527-N7)-methyltransferase
VTITVSRETRQRLQAYSDLVRKWNPKVNLVSRVSLSDLWERHILDSLQLLDINTCPDRWVDLGSGGGFPGLVVAICLQETASDAVVTLVESDQRKAAFLRTVIRTLDLNATVLAQRAEDIPPLDATTLSARALAPLTKLLGYAAQHLQEDGAAIFPKGASWEKELSDASQEWCFVSQAIKSRTEPDACLLVIRDIKKR